ncbi:hypothetical protein [Neptuniibacter sp. QD57_21]|uniref:hypothetical protein n=1 Tax=Neptuniibacter sp. QD57_21 TaxID=3398213 RepID=UPI0039F4DD64
MSIYTRDLDKELPVITRIAVGLILTIIGLLSSGLWFVTEDVPIGIVGVLMGLPCVVAGVSIVLGNKAQTSLSPTGLKVFSFILFLVGITGIYQGMQYAGLAWVFGAACYKIAKNKRVDTW